MRHARKTKEKKKKACTSLWWCLQYVDKARLCVYHILYSSFGQHQNFIITNQTAKIFIAPLVGDVESYQLYSGNEKLWKISLLQKKTQAWEVQLSPQWLSLINTDSWWIILEIMLDPSPGQEYPTKSSASSTSVWNGPRGWLCALGLGKHICGVQMNKSICLGWYLGAGLAICNNEFYSTVLYVLHLRCLKQVRESVRFMSILLDL